MTGRLDMYTVDCFSNVRQRHRFSVPFVMSGFMDQKRICVLVYTQISFLLTGKITVCDAGGKFCAFDFDKFVNRD